MAKKRTQLSDDFAARRAYWVQEIRNLSGDFSDDTKRMAEELTAELERDGAPALRDHLHMCGVIPEGYEHDSSEEKLYSKYTDILLSLAFRHIGLTSIVLNERADAADIEGVANDYSFVADAKAFRLSRTAKNQKDFKVQAMHGWKRGKPYAIVVGPIYQFPATSSQIYSQAIAHDVCVFTYSHLALLVSLAERRTREKSRRTLHGILQSVSRLNPTKSARVYWSHINGVMLEAHSNIRDLWQDEKIASLESLGLGKEEALVALAKERERIMRMSKDEAIVELIKKNKLEGRIKTVRAVRDKGLLEIT